MHKSNNFRRNPLLLGVNIDHIATLRQVRGTSYPDPIHAALLAELAGADSITVHLREDRRHIQERDVLLLKEMMTTRLNLEIACTEEMLAFSEKVKPHSCCLVPEQRRELTTESGLDVISQSAVLKKASMRLKAIGIAVSLFIDPEYTQIEAAKESGADIVELHTGAYARATGKEAEKQLEIIKNAAQFAYESGLRVNAGHGLHYHNVKPVAALCEISELNIGHSIVARAVLEGMPTAVRLMKELMVQGRLEI